MAISDLIQAIQDVAWPEFLQPHVEVLLLWITWAVDYIDLDYLEQNIARWLPDLIGWANRILKTTKGIVGKKDLAAWCECIADWAVGGKL
ncbi:hypothetical protein RB195_002456 [Necator americanus]